MTTAFFVTPPDTWVPASNRTSGRNLLMNHRRRIPFACVAAALALLAGCRQQMAQQPAYRPLEASEFFPDNRSARPIEPGTVARGQLADGVEVRTGRRAGTDPEAFARDLFVAKVPLAVTADLLERGRERFTIFCSVCHDRLGTGDGRVVQRGFTRPPSYHGDLSRGFKQRGIDLPLTEAPDGYLYEVVTRGYGAMPDYASQIPTHDRWAIVAYVRALQKSQAPGAADVERLPEEGRKALKEARENAK